MNRTEAAAALGLRENEIADVEASPAGPVITTTDGVRYIIVAEDTPDADGDHGIMFLAAPNETGGSWPLKVYAQPGAGDSDYISMTGDEVIEGDLIDHLAARFEHVERHTVDVDLDTTAAGGPLPDADQTGGEPQLAEGTGVPMEEIAVAEGETGELESEPEGVKPAAPKGKGRGNR